LDIRITTNLVTVSGARSDLQPAKRAMKTLMHIGAVHLQPGRIQSPFKAMCLTHVQWPLMWDFWTPPAVQIMRNPEF